MATAIRSVYDRLKLSTPMYRPVPMTEEPGKFFLSLVRLARPIAEKAGDIAP
jgi:hypothetical protein